MTDTLMYSISGACVKRSSDAPRVAIDAARVQLEGRGQRFGEQSTRKRELLKYYPSSKKACETSKGFLTFMFSGSLIEVRVMNW